jgi:starvation-inducible outer membrane lipoprotein
MTAARSAGLLLATLAVTLAGCTGAPVRRVTPSPAPPTTATSKLVNAQAGSTGETRR